MSLSSRIACCAAVVAAVLSSSTSAAPAVDCAQCRAACSINQGYPGDDRPELRANTGLQHKNADARDAFEEGRRLDPGLGGNDAVGAATAYKHAVMIDPDNATYRNHLAAALVASGNIKEAIYNLEKATLLAPAEAKYLVNLGYAFHKNGEEQRALVWYQRALGLDPLDARARLFAGYAMEALGLPAEAATEYRRVLVQDPTNTGARAGMARLKAPTTPPPPTLSGAVPAPTPAPALKPITPRDPSDR